MYSRNTQFLSKQGNSFPPTEVVSTVSKQITANQLANSYLWVNFWMFDEVVQIFWNAVCIKHQDVKKILNVFPICLL